jgi:hypothetical protein
MAELLPSIAMTSTDPAPWIEAKNIAVVTDSPSVMRKARAIMLNEDMFAFAYGCASHAMSNLCRDVLKLPKALSALSFATTMAKCFSNRHLPREHLRVEREKLSPKTSTLKVYSQTRWTGAVTLLRKVMQNSEANTAMFFKAKQKVIDMDFDKTFFEAVMDVSTWDAIAEWEPMLRYIVVVTDLLQSDTTPLSGVHASFLYLEIVVASSLGPSASSVDDYIVFEEALRQHILARPRGCILSAPLLPRLPRCV